MAAIASVATTSTAAAQTPPASAGVGSGQSAATAELVDEIGADAEWEGLHKGRFLAWTVLFNWISESAVYPAELVKTRLQVQSEGRLSSYPRYASTFDAFRLILRQEGLRGFYKGYPAAQAGGIPTNLLYFATYEYSKDRMNRAYEGFATTFPSFPGLWMIEHLVHFIAGGLCEMVAATVYVPADVCCSRLMIQGPNKSAKPDLYKGTIDAFVKILAAEGLRGLYRGYGANLMTYAPASAVSWTTFEFAKKTLYRYCYPSHQHDDYSNLSAAPPTPVVARGDSHVLNFLAGVIAGIVASAVVNPIDLARARLQTQEYAAGVHKYRSTLQTIRLVVAEEGFLALTHGMLARVMWQSPLAGFGYFAYELAKRLSRKDEEL